MKILIADDHPLYRQALATVLLDLDEDVQILEAGTFHEVEAFIASMETPFDLILLDLYMSGGDWGAVIAELHRQRPETPIIVISASDSRRDTDRAMRAGAFGYIPKSLGKQDILSAIRLILSGNVSVQPRPEDASPWEAPQGAGLEHERNELRARIADLTPRQRDVLREIAVGKSNKLIARTLNMHEGTVKLHVASILKCLDVTNRTQAAIIVNQLDLDVGELESS